MDGGNPYYMDHIHRAETFAHRGIDHVERGTRGGVLGLERGYSLMIAWPPEAVASLEALSGASAPVTASFSLDRTAQAPKDHAGSTTSATA